MHDVVRQFPRAVAAWLAAAAGATLAACADPVGPARSAGPPAAEFRAPSRLRADTLTVGDTLRFTTGRANPAGRTPSAATGAAWRSSNPAVATVDADGLVTAVGKGSALVTRASQHREADEVAILVRLPEEARALWVNRFEYASAAKIVEILDKAKAAHFNVVYFQVRGQGDAYYRSSLEPCAVGLCGSLGNGTPPYDPLEVAVREAHTRGLELHAWVNAFTGWASPTPYSASYCALLKPSRAGSPNHMLVDHPEWAMVGSTGTVYTCANSQAYEYAYVSPGIPAVRTHLARVAADIVRRYDVDGVHLDRIRYPSPYLSYDAPSVAAFGRAASWGDAAWQQWRRDAVSAAVREVHDSISAVRPQAVLSAAVWSIYDRATWGWPSSSGVDQYFQDPRAWAAGGYFDVQVPMTYFKINPAYCSYASGPDWACLLDDHLAGYDGATGRHTHIGITADPKVTTDDEIARQIALGRARGVRGFSIYSYNAANARDLFAWLAAGPFAAPSDVPRMPWKADGAGTLAARGAARSRGGAP